jgi:hypothetical protein
MAASEGQPGLEDGAAPDSDMEALEAQPSAVVDTTAELLGRAKARKPRSRPVAAVAAPAPAARRKPAPRKSAGARKTVRTKKASAADVPDDVGNR